ncbi:MAG: hypothetical protein ACE5JJ_06340 [Nitrospinota bacterium]
MEVAKKYGTADAAPFINGILDKLSRRLRAQAAQAAGG